MPSYVSFGRYDDLPLTCALNNWSVWTRNNDGESLRNAVCETLSWRIASYEHRQPANIPLHELKIMTQCHQFWPDKLCTTWSNTQRVNLQRRNRSNNQHFLKISALKHCFFHLPNRDPEWTGESQSPAAAEAASSGNSATPEGNGPTDLRRQG